MHVVKVIFICFEVLLLFNLLIFVHELGHFLAARWRGLKIERFAIWFGKPIWKTKIGDVEYCLGSIPAGRYVSLPQMAPMELIEGKGEEKKEALPPISALDKIIVAFAGPLFSFLLAIAFALVVRETGRPVSEAETSTTIGYVEKDGPADKAGLRPGDKILEVDGKHVSKFLGMGDSVHWRVVRSEGAAIPVTVARQSKDGTQKVMTFDVTPTREETKAWERKSLREILILPSYTAIVGGVYSNSPAALAGLRPKDYVLELNGTKLLNPAQVGEYVEQHPTDMLTLKIRRDGTLRDVSLQPEVPIDPPDQKKPRLGIKWADSGIMTLAHPGPLEQVRGSVDAMVGTFGALFAKKSDIKAQHLGGAIKIFSVYYILFQSEQGWRLALWFSVLMNVNLAILNMLPFPVLDGGHITLALIEAFRRKPVGPRILNVVQTTCAVLLIFYMLKIL